MVEVLHKCADFPINTSLIKQDKSKLRLPEMRDNYSVTSEQNPHAIRSREMLKKYPEIRGLMGYDPTSALYITGITIAQIAIAGALSLKGAPWWAVALCAYLVGAFFNHALFTFVHEAAHDNIFKKKVPNRIWGIISNVAQGFPSASGFKTFHLIHHSNMGEYDHDADLAFHWEAKIVGNSWWRKSIWFLFFFLIATILVTNALIFYFLGPVALIYLVLSTLFSVGLHPVGARWIQEHYTYKEGQETYSYYGPLNRIQFNIGYHNEHHDFYKVPWRNLRKLKAMAPEYYDNLYAHSSWTALILDFIFNPERDLYQRIIRERTNSDRQMPTETNATPVMGK
jgi:sphingolipid delta-4 desaturase